MISAKTLFKVVYPRSLAIELKIVYAGNLRTKSLVHRTLRSRTVMEMVIRVRNARNDLAVW